MAALGFMWGRNDKPPPWSTDISLWPTPWEGLICMTITDRRETLEMLGTWRVVTGLPSLSFVDGTERGGGGGGKGGQGPHHHRSVNDIKEHSDRKWDEQRDGDNDKQRERHKYTIWDSYRHRTGKQKQTDSPNLQNELKDVHRMEETSIGQRDEKEAFIL